MQTARLKVEYAEIRVSNADNADRTYDISAMVRVEGATVTAITQGSVNARATEEDGMAGQQLASFDMWSEPSLNVSFQTADSRTAILAAIEAFAAKAKAETAE